jgi:hypothetical protein
MAMNKTIATVKSRAARKIREEIGGTYLLRDVRRRLKLNRASRAHLVATVMAGGAMRESIALFDPRKTRAGISFSVGRKRVTIPHAFLARVRGGKRAVFVRAPSFEAQLYDEIAYRAKRVAKGGHDLPIAWIGAPGVPLAFVLDTVTSLMRSVADERFPIEVEAAMAKFDG